MAAGLGVQSADFADPFEGFSGQAKLVVSQLTLSSAKVDVGHSLTIRATIANLGNEPVHDLHLGVVVSVPDFEVLHQDPDKAIDQLSPGESVLYSATVRLDKLGNAKIGVAGTHSDGMIPPTVKPVTVQDPMRWLKLGPSWFGLFSFAALLAISTCLRSGAYGDVRGGRSLRPRLLRILSWLGCFLMLTAFAYLAYSRQHDPYDTSNGALFVAYVLLMPSIVALYGRLSRMGWHSLLLPIGGLVIGAATAGMFARAAEASSIAAAAAALAALCWLAARRKETTAGRLALLATVAITWVGSQTVWLEDTLSAFFYGRAYAPI